MKSFLPREEEYRLFTLIWNGLPGAQEAREALIANNLATTCHFLREHPGCWYFDEEERESEAYTVLAECIARVPAGCSRPGGYLYRVACNNIRDRFQSPAKVVSLDEARPGTDDLTLHDVIATPDRGADLRTPVLTKLVHERLHQLPVYQQRALRDYFGLSGFEPMSRPGSQKPSGKVPSAGSARVARKRAYAALRRDQALREAVLQ